MRCKECFRSILLALLFVTPVFSTIIPSSRSSMPLRSRIIRRHTSCKRVDIYRKPSGGRRIISRMARPGEVDEIEKEAAMGQLAGMSKMINTVANAKPEIVAIMMVYFVQGILGLSSLATTFFFKDELGLDPAEVAALTGITSLPWVIKPLYGFISDTFPLFGYRRRSYLFLFGLLGSISWATLATAAHTTTQAITALTFASLSIAASDVVVDSITVERSRESQAEAGTLQSLCWGSRYVGAAITAYLSGQLLETMSPRTIFGITALFPLLVTVFSNAVQEDKEKIAKEEKQAQVSTTERLTTQVKEVWKTARAPNVLLPMLFVLAWQATPSAGTGFFYFLTNELQMKPEFLGRIQVATSVASLLGVWLYQTWLKEVELKKLLTVITIISVPLSLTQLILINRINQQFGIPDSWFAIGDDVILSALGEIAFMPLLVIAAKVCPPGVEGTLFATLMSGFNFAGIMGQELGAGLTKYLGVTESNFGNLGQLVTICSLSSLFPLLFINNLDMVGFQEKPNLSEKNEM
mmetsp:Transcript_13921/g.21036  ORF Transcript_13921/g.21036 Transcript_13921/m.21036 type:complete len:524 (+) Transcript_13921:67-1638(+)